MRFNTKPTRDDLIKYALPSREIFLGHIPDHDELIKALDKKYRNRFKYYDLGDHVGITHKNSDYLICRVCYTTKESKRQYVIKSFRIDCDRAKYHMGRDSYHTVSTTNLGKAANTISRLAPITDTELVGISIKNVERCARPKLVRNQTNFSKCRDNFTDEICGSNWGDEKKDKRNILFEFIEQTINAMDGKYVVTLSEGNSIVQKYRECVKTANELANTINDLGKRVILHVAQLKDKLYLGYSKGVGTWETEAWFVQVPSIEALPQAVQRHIHTVNIVEGHDCDAGFMASQANDLLTDTHYALFISEDEVEDVVQKLINQGTKYDHDA